jgi:autotransporter-associated beta strand protein
MILKTLFRPPLKTGFAALLSLALIPSNLLSADFTWDGEGNDGVWSTPTNWTADAAFPGLADNAIFNSTPVGPPTPIKLGGSQSVNHLIFNGGASSYTIGEAGVDTLTFAGSGGVDTNPALANDQTIAANITIGDGSVGAFRIDTQSTTHKIIFTGDIAVGTGAGTAGVQRFEVGDLAGISDGRLVQIDGDLTRGAATRVDILVGGADLLLNGKVEAGTGNVMRTIIKDGATATVFGNFGSGAMEVRNGTLNINTDTQQFDSLIILGDTTGQAGNALVNIGSTNTLILNTGINYEDRTGSNDASVATISGGKIRVTGANRTFVVHDNLNVERSSPELTISSDIINDGQDRDLSMRAANNEATGGTLVLSGNNSAGGFTVQAGTLILGSDTALDTGGDFLFLSARNATQTAQDTKAYVDIKGTKNTITGLTFGAANTASIAGTNGFTASLTDSLGTGSLTLNNIIYNDGSANKENAAATITDVNLIIEANRVWTINGNVTDTTTPRLIISGGTLDDDDGTRDITVIGDGTLSLGLTSADNDRWIFSNPNTILTDDTLGNGRVFVQQRNNAALSDFDVKLDINGQTIDLHENLVLGNGNTVNVAEISTLSVVDSVGTGKLIFSGDNPTSTNPQRQINNNAGSATNRNITSIVDVHVHVNGGSMVLGAADTTSSLRTEDTATGLFVDMDFTGSLTSDNNTRQLQKNSNGTLRFSPTQVLYGALAITNGNVIVKNLRDIGTDDVTLGSNANSGSLYYTGGAGILTEEFRIGDNNAAATRTGGGSLINNGNGTLKVTGTVSGGVLRFNEARTAVTVNRTLTLGGTSNIEILGSILDNNTTGNGTISVTKTGTNTVSLLGKANTYTGNTSVNEGILNINGTSITNIAVASGANLGGDGTTSGNIVFNGTTHTILVDGLTAGALGTTGTGQFDLTAANVTIDLQNKAGAGAFDVIVYGNGTNVGFNDESKFTVINAPHSDRDPGAGIAFTTTAITYDAGYQAKTWAGTDATTPTSWDVSSTENWTGGTDNLFFDGDSVTFDDNGSSTNVVVPGNVRVGNMAVTPDSPAKDYNISGGNITIDGTMTLGGGNTSTSSGGNDIVISSRIIGDGSVLVADGDKINDGNGNSVTLSGDNAYTGGTVLGEGRLSITNSNALGTGLVTIEATNTAGNEQRDPLLDLDADGLIISNNIFIGDNDTKVIRLDNGGNSTSSGELSGSIVTSENGDTGFRVEVGRNDVLTVSGKISGNHFFTRSNYKDATFGQQGTVVLANAANDFKGNLVVGANTSVASIGNVGEASHAGAGAQLVLGINANSSLTNNNNQFGTLLYTGSGDSTDKRVQVGNFWFSNNHTDPGIGGTIANNGTGALAFTNSQFSQVENNGTLPRIGARTLTLAGSYTGGTNQIQGTILDNGVGTFDGNQTVALEVDTGGTWEVSGNSSSTNGYSGGTTVTAGTLLVNNTAGSGVGFGNVTVGNGTGTANLGGSGTLLADNATSRNVANLAARSSVSIGANGTHHAGATIDAGSVGTQTIAGDLSYADGATIAWDLVSNSVTTPGTDYDQFVVNNGGSVTFNSSLNLEITFGTGVDFGDAFWNSGGGVNEWQIIDGTINGTLPNPNVTFNTTGASNSQFFTDDAFKLFADNIAGTDINGGYYLRQLAPIPEPSTYALMALILGGFGWVARRRRLASKSE